MIASWVLLALVGLLGLLVALRLDLGKMALRYLFSNPRQTALAVVGLMMATSTIVGSAIVSDSAAAALESEMARIRGESDLAILFEPPIQNLSFVDDVEEIPAIESFGWLTSTRVTLQGPTGFLLPWGDVHGFTPEYPDAMGWDVVDGDEDDLSLVLTESMATRINAGVGDSVSLIFPANYVIGSTWNYVQDGDSVHGQAQTQVTAPNGEVIAVGDRFTNHTLAVPSNIVYLRMGVTIQDTGGTGWNVQWEDPTGNVSTNSTEAATGTSVRYERIWEGSEEFIQGGDYSVSFHAQGASNTQVTVYWDMVGIEGTPPWEHEDPKPIVVTRTVSTIVGDGANPIGNGQSAFLPYEDFIAAAPGREGVSLIVAQISDTKSVRATGSNIAEQAQKYSTGNSDVRDLRTEPAQEAEALKRDMQELWIFMGGFTVLGAVILLFVLVALLVDERRSTLATVRALGAGRNVLVRVQMFEVFGLAVMAGLVGGLAGLLVARVLASALEGLWDVDGLTISFSVLLDSIALGILVMMVFAVFAAWRASRLEIAPALKDHDAPARGSRIRDMVIAVIVTLAGVAVVLTGGANDPVAVTMGIPLVALGGGIFCSRWLPKTLIYPIVGAVLLVWMVLTYAILAEVGSAAEALMLPLRALLFSIGGALVFAYLRPLHHIMRWLFGWLPGSIHLENAVAQWRTRPGRAALTIVMLAMMLMSVLFMTSLVSQEQASFGRNVGGFDVYASSREDLMNPDQYLEENPPIADIDPFQGIREYTTLPWTPFMPNGMMDGGDVHFSNAHAVTPEFVEMQRYGTVQGIPAQQAFQEILSNPDIIIVDQDVWIGTRALEAGDEISYLNRTGVEFNLRVYTITDGSRMQSAYFHPDTYASIMDHDENQPDYVGTAIVARIDSGEDGGQVVARMETAFLDANLRGMHIAPDYSGANAVQSVLGVFVVLALAIGAVALGLIAARNTVRRRREIGMIRAIGGTRRQVVATITLETMMLVFVAVVIGWTGAALLLRGLVEDSPFSVDGSQASLLALYTLALGAIAAIVPAYAAARLDPAVAVRNQE